MRRLVQLVLLLLSPGLLSLHAGEVIDRIAVTVNNSAILQSDVEIALRCEAFLDNRRVESLTAADEQAALQRLIDQELLRQQMAKDLAPPKPAEVAERLRQVRNQVSAGDEKAWREMLARYSVTEAEVAERVAMQMQIARFLEQRLRPGIRVEQASIQAYYTETLLPELRKSGVTSDPPLRDVRPQIQEILLQQRMDEELSSWLRTLRQQSRIHTTPETASPSAKDDQTSGSGKNGG